MSYTKKNVHPYAALLSAAETNQWSPVYFLYGEESFLKEKALLAIRQGYLRGEEDEIRLRPYYFPESEVEAVAVELETLPFFGLSKLVIIHNVELIKDKDWERLEPLLPNEERGLLVVCLADKVDRRKKIFKHLLNRATAIELKPPFENQLGGWIRSFTLERSKEIHADAIRLLHERVGGSLAELDMAIEKLCSYIGERNQIDIDDVDALIDSSRSENVFQFTEAVGMRNEPLALEMLDRLIRSGQSEVGLVSLIARHLRILMLVQLGRKKALPDQEMASFCGVPPYFLRQYLSAAQLWSPLELRSALLKTADAERLLKSSPLDSIIVLESLLFGMSRSARLDSSSHRV